MTYPGLDGTPAGSWVSRGQMQVRQSFAGYYPGQAHYQSVVNSWGSNAPASATTAAADTVMEEYADEPHPIEEDNFELADAYGGTEQFGVDPTSPSVFVDEADPGYTGE